MRSFFNGSKYLRIKKILAAQRPKFLRFESEDSGKTVFLSGLGAGAGGHFGGKIAPAARLGFCHSGSLCVGVCGILGARWIPQLRACRVRGSVRAMTRDKPPVHVTEALPNRPQTILFRVAAGLPSRTKGYTRKRVKSNDFFVKKSGIILIP